MTQLALNLAGLAVALGVPALIAFLAPRRWRPRAIILWTLAPLLVLLALGAGEIVTGKAGPADLDNLVFGLLLIGSFLLLPWLLVCAAGYAVGALLRRKMRPEPAAAAPAPATPAPPPAQTPPPPPPPLGEPVAWPLPADPAAPTLAPPSGWRPLHVGFEHDDLKLDGLPVWSLAWRDSGERIVLPHPAHPAQQHEFSVYDIDDGARAARFAAEELSNGVWGFYRWLVEADPASGASADGTLRFEHDLGPFESGRYDTAASVARLYDDRTDALLFDGADWLSSRIVPQADGALLLDLVQGELQTIFRIEPAGGLFRDLASPRRARPLAELAAAAAAARAEPAEPAGAYLGRRVAPDGSLMVELQAVEWSNTHWVRSPRITEIATGRVLLDLWRTDWDAWPSFPRPGAVRLSLRRYRIGGAGLEAEIELAPERYILFEPAGPVAGPLRDFLPALERAAQRAAAWAPARAGIPARPTARSWLVALMILLGALALVAVGALVSLRLEGERPPQKLDVIPPMPGPPPPRPPLGRGPPGG